MQTFVRLANLILPTSQIKSVTTPTTTVNGEAIVQVAILALTDTFNFDGQVGSAVYGQLEGFVPAPKTIVPRKIQVLVDGNPVAAEVFIPGETTPVAIVIDGQIISTDSIEWADINTNFGTEVGVELRLSTDAPGITHQYLGASASQAYDALAALVPETATAA